jgi:hypothetical protein
MEESAATRIPALAGSELLVAPQLVDMDPEFEDVINDAVEITDCHVSDEPELQNPHDDSSNNDDDIGADDFVINVDKVNGSDSSEFAEMRDSYVNNDSCENGSLHSASSQLMSTKFSPKPQPVVTFQQSFELCIQQKANKELPILLDDEVLIVFFQFIFFCESFKHKYCFLCSDQLKPTKKT